MISTGIEPVTQTLKGFLSTIDIRSICLLTIELYLYFFHIANVQLYFETTKYFPNFFFLQKKKSIILTYMIEFRK